MLHCNTQEATSTFDMFKAYHTLTTIFARIFRRRQIFNIEEKSQQFLVWLESWKTTDLDKTVVRCERVSN